MTSDELAAEALGRAHVADVATRFATLRDLAERAIGQVEDDAFFQPLGEESNSIAVLMKHVGGNLRSRFTDFLTTDGEKPDRDRDGEFVTEDDESRGRVESTWAAGWRALEWALASLEPEDLLRTVTLRGEEISVLQALSRALAHIAQHVGQIVLLSKHAAGARWRTLSIAKAPRSPHS